MYARSFGSTGRRVAVIGQGTWRIDSAERAAAVDDSFVEFARWCDRTTSCALHGQDVFAAWEAALVRADGEPLGRQQLIDSVYRGLRDPDFGWVADRIGTRRLFIASVALFVLASMLCGIAQSLEEMVLFRALQGLGGAFLGPLAQSLMLDINKPSVRLRDYEDMGYYKHLGHASRWGLRKAIEQGLASSVRLNDHRLEAFGRCAVLRTAQWALDGRKKVATMDEFRAMLERTAAEMLIGAQELSHAVKATGRRRPTVPPSRPARGTAPRSRPRPPAARRRRRRGPRSSGSSATAGRRSKSSLRPRRRRP